jgi:predicted RNA polymerase sigma factor
MSESAAHAAVEAVARHSYGRLIAYLAARSGDIADAEDALSEAFGVALQRWLADGVPQKPEAWLLHAARNRLADAARHAQVRKKYAPLLQLADEAEEVRPCTPRFPMNG